MNLALFFNQDLTGTREYENKLTNSVEKAIAKSLIKLWVYWFEGGSNPEEQLKQSWEIIQESETIYQIPFLLFEQNYYHGLNEPILDENKVKEIGDRISILENRIRENTWEYHFIRGLINLSRALKFSNIGEFDKAIEYEITSEHHFKHITRINGNNNLGIYYTMSGRFEDAEEQYKGHWDRIKPLFLKGRQISFYGLPNLIYLLFVQGKFEEMKSYIEEGIGVAEKARHRILLIKMLSARAYYYYRPKGFYDLAETDLLNIHEIVELPSSLVGSYNQIIGFYEERYNITGERSFLNNARNWLNKFENHPNLINQRQTWKDIYCYNQAILLAHGNFRDKAKAMTLLEELIEKFPSDLNMLTSYLKLLFEEMKVTEMEETNLQIKETIDKISQIPLHKDPRAIPQYFSQQRLLARYYFYIEGNVDTALDILSQLAEKLREYELVNMIDHVISDRREYEDEVLKWQNTDVSTKERIINSKIENYIELVRNTFNK